MAKTEDVAVRRMEREIAVLESVDDPSLVKIHDSCVDERWFVMEYMDGGTLADRGGAFAGRPLAALKALRPVVEAVARLHEAGFVHRDIKPANIFVAKDDRLILGDCGVAFHIGDGTRNTATFENVGSRDFQPPWSYGQRVEEIGPAFDAFSLGKVLWAMASGKPVMQLWYFDRNGNDLRDMFPRERGMMYIHRILERCIVESKEDMKVRGCGRITPFDGCFHLGVGKRLSIAPFLVTNAMLLLRCRGNTNSKISTIFLAMSKQFTRNTFWYAMSAGMWICSLGPRPEGTGERMPPGWRE